MTSGARVSRICVGATCALRCLPLRTRRPRCLLRPTARFVHLHRAVGSSGLWCWLGNRLSAVWSPLVYRRSEIWVSERPCQAKSQYTVQQVGAAGAARRKSNAANSFRTLTRAGAHRSLLLFAAQCRDRWHAFSALRLPSQNLE